MINKAIFDVENNWDWHLDRYQKYVRQPSVSGTGQGMREMADLIANDLKSLGCTEVSLVATEGYPVVKGFLNQNQPKTILIYGMYDVQPVENEKWITEPFSGNIINLPKFGDCIVSRGITNQKGPLAGFLNVVENFIKNDISLPVNLIFFIEGEEEIGSVHLPYAIETCKEELKNANCVFFPHFSQNSDGKVELYMGSKGVLHIELTCEGGDWGGPVGEGIHGCNAVWMDNPIWKMIHVLASLKNEKEEVLVDGFYDDVSYEWPGDELILDQLLKTFSEEEILSEWRVKKFKNNLHGRALLKRYFYYPELNINGIFGGHVTEGSKTLLPHKVTARIDVRLVPKMQPEDIMNKIKKHLSNYPEISYKMVNAYNWARTPYESPAVQSMVQAMKSLGFEAEPWITMAGSAPFSLFESILGLPSAFGGLGHGAQQHCPNEYASIEGFKLFEKSCIKFLENIAKF